MSRRRIAGSRWRRHRLIRRGTVACLVGLALASVVRDATAPAPGGTVVSIAVAAADLAIGTALTQADVAVTSVAADSPLAGTALMPDDIIGRTTAGQVREGEAITASRLVDTGTRRPGFTTMPVTFTDPDIAEFLNAGMIVDLVWTPGEFADGSSRIIAAAARIVRVTSADEAGAGGLPVLVEVAADDAIAVAAAMSSGSLSVLVSSS